MPANVVLIGFMGAGKSVVGAALAERLGFELVDTDSIVTSDAGMDVPAIFAAEGENGFRRREAEAVVKACAGTGRVIACGGGAILALRNYQALRSCGPIVFLRTSADELIRRLGEGRGRPLLEGSVSDAVPRLLAERGPAYDAAADLVVDTDGRDPDALAEQIARELA
jgi:shikimate kinase